MSNECLNSGECQQYCKVLDSLTDNKKADTCEWPKHILTDYNFSNTDNPELGLMVADSLLTVLSTGNKIKNSLEEEGGELSAAHKMSQNIFSAHLELWKSYGEASKEGRVITDIEVEFFTEKLKETIADSETELKQAGVDPEVLTLAQAMHDRRTLEDHGLLFDENMIQMVTNLCVNVSSGRSSLAIGDKGIAKTQAAKFVSGLFANDGNPKFISGDGSMMKDEFMGKMTLTEENGATVTTFQHGILTECMEKGIPLVMDEINLIDPAIAMRLQDILLRKPGDVINIQEDGGEAITIKHGFCVIATANEASSRYQSRAALDPAFRDRFRILPIEYPDGDTTMLQDTERPSSLARLAYAFVVSENGIKSERILPEDALWLASIAHASQQLYSKPAKDVKSGLLGNKLSSVVDDTEPRMSDCITPRKMVDILQNIASGLNPYDIESGVKGLALDSVASMQHSDDRETMLEIIRLMHDGDINDFDEDAIKKRLRL